MSVVVPGKLVLSTITSLNPERFFDKSLATDLRNERSGSLLVSRGVGIHTMTMSEDAAFSVRFSVAFMYVALIRLGRCLSFSSFSSWCIRLLMMETFSFY